LCDEFSDSKVASITIRLTDTILSSSEDLVLVNTCSIRDKAEQTVRKRLEKYNAVKRINQNESWGSRLYGRTIESQFLEEEKIVDLVVDLMPTRPPNLLAEVEEGRDAINVILSKDKPMVIFHRFA
jgi:tRNA-2-methylthio-N6-dimethylallyladenosine synthase